MESKTAKLENETMDSYNLFFRRFGLDIDKLYDWAYNEGIIWPEDGEPLRKRWEDIKAAMLGKNNEFHLVVRRFSGTREGHERIERLYQDIFNVTVHPDPTNNAYPQGMINEFFGGVERNVNAFNYQVSHIVERRTINPILFQAPWFICLTPKIFDPFTGHETVMYEAVAKRFRKDCFEKWREYILDYNDFVTNVLKVEEKFEEYGEEHPDIAGQRCFELARQSFRELTLEE